MGAGRRLLFFLLFSLISATSRADWAVNYGGLNAASVKALSIATDISGNVFLSGTFTSSTLDLGGVTLTRIGSTDSYVVQMDSSGTVIWAKNFGGVGSIMTATSLAVDASGNVYLGGTFSGANLTIPALTKLGGNDAFALKLDSSGNTAWAKNFGGAGATSIGSQIAVDASSNVYLAGSFSTANLTTPALTKLGGIDAFALKLNSSGTTTWAKNFGGSTAYTIGNSITVDASSNVYLCGYFFFGNLTTPSLTALGGGDAFAFKLDSSGNTTWAKNFGGAGSMSNATSIAVDSSSNVYLGGTFSSANMTAPALTKIGNSDAFALKLDSSGNTTWAKNFGGVGSTVGSTIGIKVDSSSNVYLGGHFSLANMTSPALTKIGTYDAFALKLDSSGNTTWAKNFGGGGASSSSTNVGLSVDSSGNVYLVGDFQEASMTTPALTKIGAQDAFALKLDSSGNTTWAQNFGGFSYGGNLSGTGIVKDAAGNIYLTGSMGSSRAVFGNTTLSRIGISDAFVVKTDFNGTVLWAKNFGGSGATVAASGLAVDASNNVYLTGTLQAASMTTPALTKIGVQDAFALKLDSSGNTTWAKNFGGAGATVFAMSIAVDTSSHVYLGGYFQTTNLTTPALTKIGSIDAYAFKLDSSGNTTWAKNFGGSSALVYGNSLTVDSSSNVYLGGSFQGSNMTTPALTRLGLYDAFVLKLDSSGNTTWSKNYGGSGVYAYGNSLTVDASSNVYFGGNFSSASMTAPALTKIGTSDAFALKLDSSGNTTWAKNFGGSGAGLLVSGIVVDGNAHVYLGGSFSSANMTAPALTKIGSLDGFAFKLDSTGSVLWAKNFGGSGANVFGSHIAKDGHGNVYLAGSFLSANMTTPALTKLGTQDAFIIDTQLFNGACTGAGKIKFDTTNNVMVFCDGSNWQSMNNTSSVACSGVTTGKLQYYANGASSDFVWYAGSCRSAKKTSTTYGACTVNGKFEWDAGNSTVRGCINGTWTSLKGW